ncbi:MAG: hypothetical protein A4E57_00748 [Syntrophorhabdaceae bacterium PtaU1.Bin034]|nr:MAG: hypothetical protein A4E57_00748 [Syntrophorhabdaceae bacterium PtaU1.Bin034]
MERQILPAEIRRGDKTVFYTSDHETVVADGQKEFFDAVRDPDGDYRSAMTIADAKPERRLIRMLCDRDNASSFNGRGSEREGWKDYPDPLFFVARFLSPYRELLVKFFLIVLIFVRWAARMRLPDRTGMPVSHPASAKETSGAPAPGN